MRWNTLHNYDELNYNMIILDIIKYLSERDKIFCDHTLK